MSWNDEAFTFETCLENKKFFKEEDIQRIMRDLVIGLEYLHTNNMVHRDIKPQNIMLDEIGKSKYGDFGTSIVLPDGVDEVSDFIGTHEFLAPECFGKEKYSAKMQDIWALGATFYALTYQKLPFYGAHNSET